ncbi:MAG TPA: F0F1 ATP synthase subunit delta [Gammaproteobacteria bacterium]|jgi:F-type H+-transporting ATPase subunit delta|nr:F0F1 ATP synthase subunit delta [Gammaproteobacteria bacterium]
MAESTTIARPYAQAAIKLAQQNQALPAWSEMLGVAAVVAADAGMRKLLDNPRVTPTQLAELFVDICGDRLNRLNDDGRNMLRLLAERRRLVLLPEIFGLYEQFKNEAEGAVQAQLISAFPATDAQKQTIAAALKQRFGRDVQMEYVTDPTLMGGAVVRAGDLVIDGSVRGKLTRLGAALNH